MEDREKYIVGHTPEGQQVEFEKGSSEAHKFIVGRPGAGRELKGLRTWAKELELQLPEGYEPDPVTFTHKEACAIFRDIGVLPDPLELNPVQIVALSAFPDIEKVFPAKLKEGYNLLTFKYEANEQTGHESLDIIFSKGYERYVLGQGKGCYAGGYSHATFGREGERGEIL